MGIAGWAIAFCGIATVIHLVSILIAARRCRRPRGQMSAPLPPVSLIIPVCGIEKFTATTLAASFAIAHPNYEILFCVARGDDPVVPLVRGLIARHAGLHARLLIGDSHVSANPKLNNVVKGWEAARHRWIVIADCNALLPPDALRRLLGRWRHDTGLVCSMPIGARPAGFWADVECAFLNTLQARYQYGSEAVGSGFAQGKVMLFDRDLVGPVGGIQALAAETAEDAATTKLIRELGRHVHLVDRPFEQPLGERTAGAVWSRQLRWARLRRISFPLVFLPEIMVGSALPGVALALAAWHLNVDIAGAVGLLLVTWFGAEAGMAVLLGWHFPARMLLALLVRDLVLPVLFVAAWSGRDFVWRGHAMRATPAAGPPAQHPATQEA
ncbi:MAG: glycosyltransferase [Alphaproteobacteria bacterium]|nr:glycosyltransferase [Alphaproteobacteria bacterium]